MLKVPSYIAKSGVCDLPIAYTWKPKQDVEIKDKYSKNVERLVEKMSLRASLSLGIAIGEWLTWRLDRFSTYKQTNSYIEALWARTASGSYLKVDHLNPPKDTGEATVGPLLALEHALYGMLIRTTYDEPERGKRVAQIVALVRYTLGDAAPFDRWVQSMIERLITDFEVDPEDRVGSVVPRAFLDPDVRIDLEQVPRLLDEQLRQIEWLGNPFLATPEEMLAAGFEGIPYRYQP